MLGSIVSPCCTHSWAQKQHEEGVHSHLVCIAFRGKKKKATESEKYSILFFPKEQKLLKNAQATQKLCWGGDPQTNVLLFVYMFLFVDKHRRVT